MNAVIESEYLLVAMRSLWCIRTAAQIVPPDDELAVLSQSVLSKVRQMRTLRAPRVESFAAYLGTLYTLLVFRDENRPDARRALIEEPTNTDVIESIFGEVNQMLKKCLFFLYVSVLFAQNTFAEHISQWHLPEGAKARLGKGSASSAQIRDSDKVAGTRRVPSQQGEIR